MQCINSVHVKFLKYIDRLRRIQIEYLSGGYLPSLVSRPFKRRRRKGLVLTAHACAGVSIATGRVTIVIVCGFYMTYSSMDDKWRVYNSI